MPDEKKVVKDWRPIYAEPIRLKAGGRVTVEDRPSEWPGWVWAAAADGRSGWAPLAWLDRDGDQATARRDYDATELAGRTGETVSAMEFESGWYWARAVGGAAGWIPADCLEP